MSLNVQLEKSPVQSEKRYRNFPIIFSQDDLLDDYSDAKKRFPRGYDIAGYTELSQVIESV